MNDGFLFTYSDIVFSPEHARRYPDGQLAEEREVLGIQAMVRSGNYAEARSRAQAFLTNYPDSPLHRVVQATVNSIP